MYKIFINEYPLVITNNEDDFYGAGNYRIVDDSEKSIVSAIETLENSDKIIGGFGLMIMTENEEECFRKFARRYQRITAAGGLVYNPERELLLIKRQGKWDLPKGKRDEGEKTEEAAVREVKEECGLEEVALGDFITATYHTYFLDNKRVLKTTYWYEMKALKFDNLIPQLEENITEVRWVNPETLDLKKLDTYQSIRSLLHTALAR